MPQLPPVPAVVNVVLLYSYGGDATVVNRLHYKYSGTPPQVADLNTAATVIFNSWTAQLEALAHPTVTLHQVTVTDLTSPSSAQGLHAGGTAGTRTGGQLPASTSVLVNYKLTRRYRGGKPRTYWPLGSDTDLNTPQLWTLAAVNAFQAGVDAFNTSVLTVTWAGGALSSPVNVSYYSGFTAAVDPITGRTRDVPKLRPTPLVDTITQRVVNSRLGTQRRRVTSTG